MEVQLEKNTLDAPREYGGFWIRFAAYLLDSIIVGIPLMILSFIILFAFLGTSGAIDAIVADPEYLEANMTEKELLSILLGYVVILIVNFLVTVAYYCGLQASKWQGTVGKKLLGLKVSDLYGNRITFWRALGRYLAMIFLSPIFMIGFIMAAFTAKKQSLHDMIARTIVVKEK